jgi:predicted transcriptional regulator
MKFEATLRGRVLFERTFTVYAKNEEDAGEIAEEMFQDTLNENDECEVEEICIDELNEEYQIVLESKM